MSKKMKGVSYDPSPYRPYEDPKTWLKHQALMQDYQELQKETKSIKNRLDNTKERKSILLAEVRFLQRRYKQLLRTKHDNLGVEQQKRTQIEKFHIRNEASLQRRAIQSSVGFKKEIKILNGKGSPQPQFPLPTKNKQKRIAGKKATISSLDLKKPILDLNQKGEAAMLSCQAPVFDLNQIAREDNDEVDYFSPVTMEDPRKTMNRMDDQLKLQLSCRNVGNGNRAVKRKSSWQDPVALRV